MTDVVDLTGLKQVVEGIGDQISTAINIDKVRRDLNKAIYELRPNLLDNWYFKRRVNQRGATGTITNKGYFIDRWKLVDGSVTITSDGIILDGVIQQILEFSVDQSTTATILTSDGIAPAEYDDSLKTFQIEAHGESIIAAKLEVGNDQSLAFNDNGEWYCSPPDIGEQMRRCMRFYQRHRLHGSQTAPSSQWLMCDSNFPVIMRATPSFNSVAVLHMPGAGSPTREITSTAHDNAGITWLRFAALDNGYSPSIYIGMLDADL